MEKSISGNVRLLPSEVESSPGGRLVTLLLFFFQLVSSGKRGREGEKENAQSTCLPTHFVSSEEKQFYWLMKMMMSQQKRGAGFFKQRRESILSPLKENCIFRQKKLVLTGKNADSRIGGNKVEREGKNGKKPEFRQKPEKWHPCINTVSEYNRVYSNRYIFFPFKFLLDLNRNGLLIIIMKGEK